MAGLTRLISTSTIQPTSGDRHPDFDRKIELTPSDIQYLWFDYSQVGLLYGKPNEAYCTINNRVEHLKVTLSQALDRLYPLAGRLVATEYNGDVKTCSFCLACSGAGVTFIHAEAVNSVAVADILNPVVVPITLLGDLFPMTGISKHQATDPDLPLLAVQVTELADGIFIGINLSHSAADGMTFWNFVNVWAELSRGDEAAISRRGGFHFGCEGIDLPVRIPICESEASARLMPPAPPMQRRMLLFSKEMIMELKVKANAGSDREISSLQALTAHLWVCITRSRALRDSDEVVCVILVDLRSRLQPPLPQSYIGNAVLRAPVRCSAGELLEGGMGWAAQQINKVISSQSAEEARKVFFDRAKDCPPPLRLAELPPNRLNLDGSSRFDVYGNDFGWGKPLARRNGPALDTGDGRLTVSVGAVEGSIEFEATLLPETFQALAEDPEFTQYLPWQ